MSGSLIWNWDFRAWKGSASLVISPASSSTVSGCISSDDLRPVRGCPADDRVDKDGKDGITLDSPGPRGRPVVEGCHDQLKGAAAAQRGVPREQPAHDRHRGAAQQEPGPPLLAAPRLVVKSPLH